MAEKDPGDELGFDKTTPDGFKQSVSNLISKFPCFPRSPHKEKKEDEEGRKKGRGGGDGVDNSSNPNPAPKSTASHLNDEGNEYDCSFKRRGLAVIIDNALFTKRSGLDDRDGSEYDSDDLQASLESLGFDVLAFEDLSVHQIGWALTQARQEYNFFNSDCFACIVLSHGSEVYSEHDPSYTGQTVRQDCVYGKRGGPIAVKAIIDMFDDTNCPGLKNKPRLFFFQACRGTKTDEGKGMRLKKSKAGTEKSKEGGGQSNPTPRSVSGTGISSTRDGNGEESGPDIAVTPAPLYPDCLIMYATPPGYLSWRDEDQGSWFIQSLCNMIDQGALKTSSVQRALTHVSRMVATRYRTLNQDTAKINYQMPVVESKLLKDLFLRGKKN